jgi:hypothetical protein
MSVARVIASTIVALAAATMAAHAVSPHRTITCPYPLDPEEALSVVAPAKIGDLPPIDFDYPARVTRFSFRDGHLLLIAMDRKSIRVSGS